MAYLATRERLREALVAMHLDAYEVGGAVRDELAGREPNDIDIAVCGVTADELRQRLVAHGARVEALTVLAVTGARLVGFRVAAPWAPADGVEIALARTEVSTGPRYQDFDIVPDPSIMIEEDLRRRDFTVNAIAREVATGRLVDPFGGAADIGAGVLRSVTHETFRDDPLRTVRALARCARDGLTPDSRTERHMREWAPGLEHLPAEQVLRQLRVVLVGPHVAHALRIASQTHVLDQVIPEWREVRGFDQQSSYHDLPLDDHIIGVTAATATDGADERVRFAALLHDVGKPATAWAGEDGRLHFYGRPEAPEGDPTGIAHEIHGARAAAATVTRLRMTRTEQSDIPYLVEHHMFRDDDGAARRPPAKVVRKARRFLVEHGAERAELLLQLRRADRAGKRAELTPPARDSDSEVFAAAVRSEIELRFPLTVTDLVVGGRDLVGLGLEGRRIGEVQRELLRRCQENDDPYAFNDHERMLATARRIAGC